MSRVEEMTAVRAAPAQAMRALLSPATMRDWVAPDVTLTVARQVERLLPGDRFRLEPLAGPGFEYQVEAASEREVVLSFTGPWSGEERWSFVADGAETLVRRTYEVHEAPGITSLAWRTVGRALVSAHFKLELSRFRKLVERQPGVRGEIEHGQGEVRSGSDGAAGKQSGSESSRRTFDIDEG